MPIQFLRGLVADLGSASPVDGQPVYTTDQPRLYVGYSSVKNLVGVLHNIAATAAPGVNDDAGDGYSEGSTWTDVTNDKSYVCVDASTGAAVWIETTQSSSDIQTLLDGISTTQGTILYNDGTDWVALGTGTAGQVLKTGGAGANPSWLGSANVISLLAAADYAAMRALLDLEVGTDFLSPAAIAAAYQPLDSTPTFTDVTVDDEAYDATGWNGDLTVPTKNAVRDKIESMGGVATVASANASITVTGTAAIDAIINANWLNGFALINGYIAASVAANAVTFAVKNAAGSDPSSGNPVKVVFRGSSGDYSVITLTAANTFTVSSGSTLDATANVPFRLWVVGFNDSGTFRLGVINCRSGINIYPLDEYQPASSTAEGGSGGADNAHIFYTGTAVTGKFFRTLAAAEWGSGLATPGAWASGPSLQPVGPNTALPGHVQQRFIDRDGGMATGSTTIPADNSIPQSGEGIEFLSQQITPRSAANILRVTAQVYGGATSASSTAVALFQDSGADALATAIASRDAGGGWASSALRYEKIASSLSSTTFKIRAGASSGNYTFNGTVGTAYYGGTLASFLQIEEVVA